MLWVAAAGCVEPYDGEVPDDAVVFGALLPFTGDRAAFGANLERGMFLARDRINDAGGINGRPLAIRTSDTHSGGARGLASANAILDTSPLVLLGPEEPEIALALAPQLVDGQIVGLLPGVTTPSRQALDEAAAWHVVAPSPEVIAGALVERIYGEDGVRRLAIVYVPDTYTSELSRLLECEFLRAGGEAVLAVPMPADGYGFERLREVDAFAPDALALVAYPESGAAIVRDWTLLDSQTRWYLAPTLDTEEFIKNVPPGALNDAVGIAAALDWFASLMATEFSAKWHDYPLTTAYYYYDAIAVAALATAKAMGASRDLPTGEAIALELAAVSTPPGQAVGWDELGRGLELVASGADVNYEGLTGKVDFEDGGGVAQSLLREWWIRDGGIEYSSQPFNYRRFLASSCANPDEP